MKEKVYRATVAEGHGMRIRVLREITLIIGVFAAIIWEQVFTVGSE